MPPPRSSSASNPRATKPPPRWSTASASILSHRLAGQEAAHRPFGGVVPEIAARAHVEALGPLIEGALADAGQDAGRRRCDRRDRRAGADRRRHGRAADGQGAGAGGGQAAGRGQPSRRPCAVAAARRSRRWPFPICCCSSRAAIASCCWSRASGAIAGSRRRSTMPRARRSTRPPSCSASAFPAARRSSAPRRWAIRRAVPLPRPLLGSAEPHFSFAGLKSAVLRARDVGQLSRARTSPPSFQQAVVDCLIDRTRRALARRRTGATALVVAGGVAANGAVRARARGAGARARPAASRRRRLWLCTDNAAMIAWAGAERFAAGLTDPLDTPARPRWPLDPVGRGGARRGGEGMTAVGVVGGGAWGTALAQVARRRRAR